MNSQTIDSQREARFEVLFRSLFRSGSGLAFPCDERGCVDINTLTERGRCNYLFACAMVGREFATPCLRAR